MRRALRLWRLKRRGYRSGLAGVSHRACPTCSDDETVAWLVGWQRGHAVWMVRR